MNRKKMARRTALHEKIAMKWLKRRLLAWPSFDMGEIFSHNFLLQPGVWPGWPGWRRYNG